MINTEKFEKYKGFCVGEYLAEELEARQWSRDKLAIEMGGDVDVNRLSLDFLIDAPMPGMLLGDDMANRIARAFGTSPQTWLNLDASWQAANK